MRRWRAFAEHLVAAVSDEFESAGRGRWAPLAERTLANRRGSAAQILVDTGRFAGSIEPDSGPDFAEAGTDVSYAVYHVSDEPRSIIPLRNPFDVDEERIAEAYEMIVTDVAAALEGAT
jgi:phage gpG-like protein